MGRLHELAKRIGMVTGQDEDEIIRNIEGFNEYLHAPLGLTLSAVPLPCPHPQTYSCKHGKTEAQRKKDIAKRRKKNKNKKTHRR